MIRWSLERGGWGQEREGERGGERSAKNGEHGGREEGEEGEKKEREGRRFKPSDLGILCKYILISFYNISEEY